MGGSYGDGEEVRNKQGNEKGGWCWPCLLLFVLLMHIGLVDGVGFVY